MGLNDKTTQEAANELAGEENLNRLTTQEALNLVARGGAGEYSITPQEAPELLGGGSTSADNRNKVNELINKLVAAGIFTN